MQAGGVGWEWGVLANLGALILLLANQGDNTPGACGSTCLPFN